MIHFRKTFWLPIAIVLVMALSFGCATTQKAPEAAKVEKKADWKFHAIVDVDFIKQYAKMPKPDNVLIVDSRPKRPKYDKGYIPTAVSIPDSKFDKMSDKLPEDKNTLLIFYCEGPT